jgi:hypothetical protein
MKNALIFCFTMLFMFSCAKDEGIDETAVMKQYPKANKEVTVEHLTLEELNAIFIANNMEPYTQDRVDKLMKKYQLKSNLYCPSLLTHADWNGDGSLTALDLVQMHIYHRDVSGDVDPTYSYSGPTPNNVIDFGYLTGIYDGVDHWVFNLADKDVAAITLLNC